jgi:hypothetical protein
LAIPALSAAGGFLDQRKIEKHGLPVTLCLAKDRTWDGIPSAFAYRSTRRPDLAVLSKVTGEYRVEGGA